MKVLELHSITKEDGYIYYIHHYKATARIEFLVSHVEIPISFTVEMNPLGIRTVDYPVIPLNKALKEFIDEMSKEGKLPET